MLGGRCLGRDGEEERRATILLGVAPDATTVPLDDALHDRQTDAGAFGWMSSAPERPSKSSGDDARHSSTAGWFT
jgi:hypothetical protein